MKALRNVLAFIAVFVVGIGYFASQAAGFMSQASPWAAAMDNLAVRCLAATVFVGAGVLAFIEERS